MATKKNNPKRTPFTWPTLKGEKKQALTTSLKANRLGACNICVLYIAKHCPFSSCKNMPSPKDAKFYFIRVKRR